MYLPSKIKPKHIGFFFLLIFLLILPFRNFVEHAIILFSKKVIFDIRRVSKQIEQLQKKNLALLSQLKDSQYLQKENEMLRKALGFKGKKKASFIGVEVISFDPSNWRRMVVIDAGYNQGMKKDLFAIDEEGHLVGRIVQVKQDYSRLLLVSDPDFKLPVFIGIGKGAFGLLNGGLDSIRVLYVEEKEQVKIQDQVWAKTRLFEAPIYVGEIKRVKKRQDDLFCDVEVVLFSQNPLLHKIFIINEREGN